MGLEGTVRCNSCGAKFHGMIGGGKLAALARCLDCDSVAMISRAEVADDFRIRCKHCKGPMRNDLLPKCPECDSRDTEMFRVSVFWD
jgi:hypothetical protein